MGRTRRGCKGVLLLALLLAPGVVHAADYYGAPVADGGGKGTLAEPFKLADLFNTPSVPSTTRSAAGNALTAPGDTLYLRGGLYPVVTSADGGAYMNAALRPEGSGTADAPITIRSYPGEIATLIRTAGKQPLVGSGDGGRSYVRILGLDVRSVSGTMNSLIQHYGSGTGNRVDSCNLIGESLATGDNHEGIEINGAGGGGIQDGATVTFCRISGFLGLPGANNAGIKTYYATNLTITDCYLFNNTTNAYNKAVNASLAVGEAHITWRRCYLADAKSMALAFAEGNVTVEDSIIGAGMLQPQAAVASNFTVRNCLVMPSAANPRIYGQRWVGPPYPTGASFYNNVVIGSGPAIYPTATGGQMLGAVGGADAPWSVLDHNLYLRGDSTAAPNVLHRFGENSGPVSYTVPQLQALGLEAGSQAISGGKDAVFDDAASYLLKPIYKTAGRDGDTLGPHDVAAVLKLVQPAATGPEMLVKVEAVRMATEESPAAVALRAAIEAALATPDLPDDVRAMLEAAKGASSKAADGVTP